VRRIQNKKLFIFNTIPSISPVRVICNPSVFILQGFRIGTKGRAAGAGWLSGKDGEPFRRPYGPAQNTLRAYAKHLAGIRKIVAML